MEDLDIFSEEHGSFSNSERQSDNNEQDKENIASNSGMATGGEVLRGNRIQRERDYLRRAISSYSLREDTKLRYYYAGVWKCDNVDAIKIILSAVEKGSSKIRFLAAFLDGDHVHVIHDCTNSNAICRCFCVRLLRRRSRRVQLYQLSKKDIDAIITYYFKEGKECLYTKIRIHNGSGHAYRIFRNELETDTALRIIQSGHVDAPDQANEAIFNYEEPGAELDSEEMFGIPAGTESEFNNEKTTRRKRDNRSKNYTGVKRNRSYNAAEEIDEKIKQLCCAPLDNAFVSKSWQTDKNFKYQCTNSSWCKAVLKAAEIYFRDLKLKDLIELYEDPKNFEFGQPLWSSTCIEHFNDMYMSRTLSYNMLLLWIGFEYFGLDVDDKMQYSKDDIDEQLWLDIANFILEWCNWFEGRIDRRFTYILLGGTKSGKTMFADLVMDLKVNVGVMGNWNRNSRNEIFNSRCIYKNVKQASFLTKANGKRYHPMCIIDLIRQCEIVLKQEIINPI